MNNHQDVDELERWASDWISAQEAWSDAQCKNGGVSADHHWWWSIDQFHVMIDEDPEKCWLVILLILSMKPSAPTLGALSAGPLEDLIEYCGSEFIDRIERAAVQSPEFRALLKGVWESGTKDVWRRVLLARGGV